MDRRLLFLLALAIPTAEADAQASQRHIIYLHARIVEEEGRRPTDPEFGIYEYDAILDSMRQAGFTVLSDQRPPGIGVDSFATALIHRVDSLIERGVPAEAITIIGFSRGGAIAILASSRMRNPALSFVFIGACGPWAFDNPDIQVTGRLLSLYETSDSLGISCAPLFERQGEGSRVKEVPLSLGLGHGTFYKPRSAWLSPALAWARGEDPSQTAGLPDSGARVRITTNPDSAAMVGTLVRWSDDSLIVALADADTVRLVRQNITELAVSRGRYYRAREGAQIGGVIGALVGLSLWLAATSGGDADYLFPLGAGQGVGEVLVFGALGAGVGALAGLASPGDRWEVVAAANINDPAGPAIRLGIRIGSP